MSGYGLNDIEAENPQYCEVSSNVTLCYELFGSGNIKVLFIMGYLDYLFFINLNVVLRLFWVNNDRYLLEGRRWSPQIEYFKKHPEFQFCVFDNRGIGKSSAPIGLYTTNQMANDALVLMTKLKWDKAHIVGISMGGMISQELALQCPERVESLTLVVTHSGSIDSLLKPWQIRKLFEMLGPCKSYEDLDKSLMPIFYTPTSLEDREKYDNLYEWHIRFRAAGYNLYTPRLSGLIGQTYALLSHHVSFERLFTLRKYPFPKLVVGVADKDHLIDKVNTSHIHRAIGGNLLEVDAGHIVTLEKSEIFNPAVHAHFLQGTASNNIDRFCKLPTKVLDYGCMHHSSCLRENIFSALSAYAVCFVTARLFPQSFSPSFARSVSLLTLLYKSGKCCSKFLQFIWRYRIFGGIIHMPIPSALLFVFAYYKLDAR